MSSFAETLHRERRERLQRFAQAAANPKMKQAPSVTVIPNTPFGVPKIKPVAPVAPEEFIDIKRQRREARVFAEGYSSTRNACEVVPPVYRIEHIQAVVAEYYETTRTELIAFRKHGPIVRPRQIAMYLSKKLTLRSLPQIGRRFAGRDHTTVLHAVRKIEWLIKTDEDTARDVLHLTELMKDEV
jgi:hypothetical protein